MGSGIVTDVLALNSDCCSSLPMSAALLSLLIALGACVYVALQQETRLFGAVGSLAAGIQVAIAMGWLSLRVSGVDLGLILAMGLAIAGGGAWFRAGSKPTVSAATAATLIGGTQLFSYF